MPNTKRFNLSIQTPDGDLPPLQIDISDEPMLLAELVPLLHALTNQVVDLAFERERCEEKSISCKAGCSICCKQLVPLAPAEVFFIVDRLLRIPAEQRRVPLECFQKNEERLASTDVITTIREAKNSDGSNEIGCRYFQLGLYCPFLLNRSCSIHQWRPLACREYNVTSPAELCEDPFHNKIETVPLFRRISKGFSRLCSHVADLPVGMVPMPLLFDYFETHKTKAQKGFPGIELFEMMLEFVFGRQK
jgi:Fe-S-cluster containining protein